MFNTNLDEHVDHVLYNDLDWNKNNINHQNILGRGTFQTRPCHQAFVPIQAIYCVLMCIMK